jgi:hypothetical protein
MIQILISLGILALWALTSLLSRETQPLPPRPARPRPAEGPRPSPSFARNDLAAANPARASSDRLSDRGAAAALSPRSQSALGTLGNDDIRILESDPRFARSLSSSSVSVSSSAPPARTSRSPSRRGSRARSAPSPTAAGTAAQARPRQLSSQINQSMARAANRPLEITPLDLPLASLASSLIPLGARASFEPASFHEVGPSLNGKSVRAMFGSPEKLREITILTEVLKPPVALRQGRPFR